MNRIHQAIAALVSLLILFLVFEGGLRLMGFGPKATMNVFDPALGWTKTPSTSIRRHTGEFDVTFATNSRGLREEESLGYEKPSGGQLPQPPVELVVGPHPDQDRRDPDGCQRESPTGRRTVATHADFS